ncbi:hypothetical protein TNCV_1384641 [Trichonephila clavipes]|nr:hypothetical protein TNCV_1384641 [Trichonephila clavipes]
MAEGNAYPSEEDFSYFCFDCRNKAKETDKDFFYVGALGPCYTCSYCGHVFEAGFKREKVNSITTASLRCKAHFSLGYSARGSLVFKVSDRGWHVTSSSTVLLKIRRVAAQCTINLSRAQKSFCGVVRCGS